VNHDVLAFIAVCGAVICTPGQDTALTIRNTLRWVDVAHRCAGRLVAGLGHDQLRRTLFTPRWVAAEWRSWWSCHPVDLCKRIRARS